MGHIPEGQPTDIQNGLTLLRRTTGMGLALTAILLLLPGVLVSQMEPSEEIQMIQPIVSAPVSIKTDKDDALDQLRTVRLLRADGSTEDLTMADYLWGVVAAEMPASFHLEA